VKEIVLATSNPDKVKEFSALGLNLIPMDFDIEETGATFEENSALKAREASRLSRKPALADDSGLCVEALNGAPGVFSARYAATAQARIEKLLKELGVCDNRRAKFVCVITLADGDDIIQATGECHGTIAFKPAGNNGFGYDPVFISDETGLTFAQMTEAEKNKISHRAIALQNLLFMLQ
jgi:XTP/dITP diphosphohydrolase